MDLDYAAIIHSVKDWFGVIALIIAVLGVSFYKITKNLSAKYQFIALIFLITAMMPVVYIKLFAEIKKPTVPIVADKPEPPEEDSFLPDDHFFPPEPEEPEEDAFLPDYEPFDDMIIGCGRVYNLLPAAGDGFLAVRSGPGKNDPKIDELYNNEFVDILKKENDRLHVIYRGDLRGWVHKTWVEDMACG